MKSVKEFSYLGRILMSTDDDWPAVARNIQKARATWGGNCGWIPVESLDDSTQEGRTTAAPLAPPDDWGAQDIQDEFTKGKQTEVTGGGMPGGV